MIERGSEKWYEFTRKIAGEILDFLDSSNTSFEEIVGLEEDIDVEVHEKKYRS